MRSCDAHITILLCALISALALGGCETMNNNRRNTGAIVGTGVGALAGAMIDDGNSWRGGVIGAAAGGLVGLGIGHVMQRQKEAYDRIEYLESRQATVYLQDAPPPNPEAHPEGGFPSHAPPTLPPPQPVKTEVIVLDMPNELIFEHHRAKVTPRGKDKLREVAGVMREHPARNIIVRNRTRTESSRKANIQLASRRAHAVRTALVSNGIHPSRIISQGMDPEGPQEIEIIVVPSE